MRLCEKTIFGDDPGLVFTQSREDAKSERTALRLMWNLTEKDGAIVFDVRVIPRSARSEIVGELDGAVKVKLSSPPVDGAANAELIKLFAKKLGVSKSAIEIVSGETSRTKRLRVTGVTAEEVRSLLHE